MTEPTYPKNWSNDVVEKFITQESQEKPRDVFEKTHVPITHIRVDENKAFDESDFTDPEQSLVGEQEVLETVTDSELRDSNRLFFVVGESGSGKSELCQWLDYQIQDEATARDADRFAHEPILIPRHVREPREVLDILTEQLDDWSFEDARYLADLPLSGIFKEVTGKIINRFNKDDEATVDFLTDDAFESVVRKNLNNYVDAFDDPDANVSFEPIPKENLDELLEKFPTVTHEHENHDVEPTEYIYREIKTGATNALTEMLSAGNIKDILKDIDEAYRERNRRPVLIIEDLTGFTIYDHQVLSFFSDLGAAHFDVIIGVTTGVHQDLVDKRRAEVASQDTINDRIQARLRLTEKFDDGSGSRTLFLEQEDIHIQLARNYLNAIKDEVAQEYKPPLPSGVEAADVEAAFGDDLYPFNDKFLTRIYDNLQEKNVPKKTPRVFLNFVIEELLNNQNPPFEHAEKLRQRLGTIEDRIHPDYENDDCAVMKWYGTDSGPTYGVDATVPATFGIESDGEAPSVDDQDFICPGCGTNLLNGETRDKCPECGELLTDDLDVVFRDQQNEMLAWLKGETNFNRTSNIETGAERVIRYFHDRPTSLRITACRSSDAAYLQWEKGSNQVPVHVTNSDTPKYPQIELTPDLPEAVLSDLLRVGVWDDVPLSGHERNSNIDLDRLREWADDAVADLQSRIEREVEDTWGVSIDEMAIFGKYIANVFSDTSTKFTPDALAQPVASEDIEPVYDRTKFDGNIEALREHLALFTGLFHARFHLRGNVVDHDRLATEMEYLDVDTLLLRVSNIEGKRSGFKFGEKSSETIEFDSFLKSKQYNLRGYAIAIDEYQPIYVDDVGSLRERLTSLHDTLQGIKGSIDSGKLADAYEPLPRTKPVVIDEVAEMNVEERETVMTQLGTAVKAVSSCESVWDFFVAQRQAGVLRTSADSADSYEQLRRFAEELDALDDELNDRITELEDETFDPNTRPLEAAQTTAQSVESSLGGEF